MPGHDDLWLKEMARMDFEEDEAKPFVKRALDAGINFFDTADVYSLGESEQILGNLLEASASTREPGDRHEGFNPMSDDVNDRGLSRKHILDSIDRRSSACRWIMWIFYQIHRWDYDTPIEETMEALQRCRSRSARLAISAPLRCSRGSS